MKIVTRFAPSPTGFLHIGGVRTALFNWLFTKHEGGKFLLRIEDTDKKRSSKNAVDAIINGLDWLGLVPDEKPFFQSKRLNRHKKIANQLLQEEKAYLCYTSQEELRIMREKTRREGKTRLYDGRWRNRDSKDAPKDILPVIRFKAPLQGSTTINDLVQGKITLNNQDLDDMILLRADGTPTYMLSAVVDDHDMGVTHILRGDDHLTNAFRQNHLFQAIKWKVPEFGHIPLIHGPDGSKLSKRHGALGINHYKDLGYLPEGILNYLMRLGWSHGNEEIISLANAIKWFKISAIGKSSSQIDFDKLNSTNAHYVRETNNQTLLELLKPKIKKKLNISLTSELCERLIKGMTGLKSRAKTLNELTEMSLFYVISRPIEIDVHAKNLLNNNSIELLKNLYKELKNMVIWSEENIETLVREFSKSHKIKLKDIAQPMRIALSGSNVSPGLFQILTILGQKETLGRLNDLISKKNSTID